MYAWHFTEMPYPNLPPLEQLSTMRVSMPSKHLRSAASAPISTTAISTST